MARTRNETIRELTEDYLDNLDMDNIPSPAEIEADLLDKTRDAIIIANVSLPKTAQWRVPTTLMASQIADIMLKVYPIKCIACAGNNADSSYDLLAMYQYEGVDKGIYVTNEQVLHNIARQYNYSISKREIDEVINILKDTAPRTYRCADPDLIAVNNGIFNYKTKQLEMFDEDLVFTSKSKVDYNPSATNVVIHNDDDNTDWNVEDWISELNDDPEVIDTIWQVIGAIIRPHVKWNKSAWFYSTSGNNGKGTLCELMRNICGEGSYAAIPLSDFSKDFMLEPLTRATAIIVDENNVGEFIDKAANLKAVITNDVIPINRKFKTPIAYQFYGFMVQCLNEFPRIKDKSDSFYRRQLFIKFDKCFTGKERKYIKADYLKRQEVLEYVLYRVLNMNYYTINEPDSCKNALNEYKDFNDPIRQFIEDVFDEFKWDLLPFGFLYDLYKAWAKKNSPSGMLQGKNTFITDLLNLLPTCCPDWYCTNRQAAIKPGIKMSVPEPLIAEYDLTDWKNKSYSGYEIDKMCRPMLKATYNGIQRVQPVITSITKATTLTPPKEKEE